MTFLFRWLKEVANHIFLQIPVGLSDTQKVFFVQKKKTYNNYANAIFTHALNTHF